MRRNASRSALSGVATSIMSACRTRNRGFTLLEMLLVVTILGSLALLASAFVDNQDDQLRFEETRQRLAQLRRATLGDENAAVSGIVARFVAENGVLPTTLNDLLNTLPTGFAAQSAINPIFDATPDDTDPDRTGYNDGSGETSLTGAGQQLVKGWIADNLQAQAGSGGTFRDGWGYDFMVTQAGHNLTFTSHGKDDAPGGTDYNQDLIETIASDHWSFEIFPRTVRVRAEPGTDFPDPLTGTEGTLRISLLVFENTASGARWKRYSTDGLVCLDGDGNGTVDHDLDGGTPEIPCPSDTTLTFPAGGYPGGTYESTRVPIGMHLLLAVFDQDGIPHTTDDTPFPTATAPVSRAVVCSAAGCPIETLVLH